MREKNMITEVIETDMIASITTLFVCLIVFDATFNNTSVISWR